MKNDKLKIESEVKIQLSKDEFEKIPEKIIENDFYFVSSNNLSDYYLKKSKSKYGGWDFIRLRSISDNKYLLTNKKWFLDKENNKIRNEDEKEISVEEFQKLTQNYSVLINKKRTNYKGLLFNMPTTVSLDELTIGKNYYFIECEITTNPDNANTIREKIFQWMKGKLQLDNKEEAPSILDFIESINVL